MAGDSAVGVCGLAWSLDLSPGTAVSMYCTGGSDWLGIAESSNCGNRESLSMDAEKSPTWQPVSVTEASSRLRVVRVVLLAVSWSRVLEDRRDMRAFQEPRDVEAVG
jgi:hypothetical protein